MKINSNNIARGENYRTQVLDIEVTADVDEVLVTFERDDHDSRWRRSKKC